MRLQESFSDVIKSEMAVQGKTRKELASWLKTSYSTLWMKLNNRSSWKLDDLDSISEFLGMDNVFELIEMAERRAGERHVG